MGRTTVAPTDCDLPNAVPDARPVNRNDDRIQRLSGETLPLFGEPLIDRLAQEPLAGQQDIFESFFTLSLDMMCVATRDGYFKRVSPAFDVLGYSSDELLCRPFLDFVHPDDRAATLAEMEKLANGLPAIGFENRYRCKDGSWRWLSWTCAPASSDLLYAIARDVTDRREAAESARRTSQFLEAIIENIPHMVFVKDAERLEFVRFNRAGEDLLGIPRAELLGKNDHDFFSRDAADRFQAADRQALNNSEIIDVLEETIQTTRGPRLLHTKKVPVVDESGKPSYLLGISEDITDRKAAEDARAWMAAIVANSNDAIIGSTLDGIVSSWNRSAERMFGYSADKMIGQPVSVLFPMHRVDEEAQFTKRIGKGERIEHYETVRSRKDGQQIDVSVTLSPVKDSAGNLIGVSKTVHDITDLKRVQRDLVRAKESAEAANRELESFSYSVAHDLRAPLRKIDGFSQVLLEDCLEQLDDDGRKHLRSIREAAQHMARLINDLLALSMVSRNELRREHVDLSATALATIARLQGLQPERSADVVIEDGVVGEGDPGLLAVVLDNLLGNAWKFTGKRDDGRIEFGTTSQGGQLVYFVRDNGAGFDMALADRLFGVFQRLHTTEQFEGTGVGLAIVQRVVSRHGGRAWADGAVGRGATFFFTLQEKDRAA